MPRKCWPRRRSFPETAQGGRAIGRPTAIEGFARLVAAALALLLAPAAAAQVVPGNAAAPAPAVAEDPFGRTTPAGAVGGYIEAIAERDYERAARYLALAEMRPSRRERLGPELAQRFQTILDRQGEFRPRTELSRDPAGARDDNLEPDLERVGRLELDGRSVPILLRRADEGETPHWVVADETLAAALALDLGAPEPPAEAWLPRRLTDWQAAGVPLSHWLTLIAVVLGAFAASWLLLRAIVAVLHRLAPRLDETRRFLVATAVPIILFAAVGLASWLAPRLGVSIVAREAFSWLTLIAGWIASAWLLWRLLDLICARVLAGFQRRGRASATAIIRVANRAAKLVILAIAAIAIFDVFGFEVTAALAALGIGGIALALGAQKTVENLIASLSIISDRPFRVGDICRIGGTIGTIEDVGMRSSRMRTLDRTLLTIPNAVLANSEIENFSARDQFWFHPMLHVAGSTPPEQLRRLLDKLRAAIEGDPRLVDGEARVRLLPPVEDRLPIEVFAYVETRDFPEFLAIQEELTMKLLDAVGAEGLSLAPPSLEIGGRGSAG